MPTLRVLALVLVTAIPVLGACTGSGGDSDVTHDRAEFVRSAAGRCSDVIDYRAVDERYARDRDAIVQGLLAVRTDKPIDADLGAALDRVAVEFDRAARELAKAKTKDTGDAAAWRTVVEAVRADAGVFRARRDAIAGGDRDRIRQAYDPSRLAADLREPLTRLGLAERDCRLLMR